MRVPSILVIASALTFAAMAGCSQKADAETKDNLVYSSPDDPTITAAEQEAAKSLPVFWAKFDAREPEVGSYLVKVGLTVQGGGREILWAVPLRHSKDAVQVRLANEPVYIADLKAGSIVEVAPEEIVDWSYTKSGKAYGHFVTRAMMDRVSPEERAAAEAMLAPTPLEPETK